MRHHHALGALSLATLCAIGTITTLSTLSACGLDRFGEQFFVEAGAREATEPETLDASAPVTTGPSFANPTDPTGDDSGGASGSSIGADAPAPDAASGAASDDGAALVPMLDAGNDAAGPCARLLACCPNLLAPMFVLPCSLTAIGDAGDVACEMSIAQLASVGACP
jgi:hypothetical protein